MNIQQASKILDDGPRRLAEGEMTHSWRFMAVKQLSPKLDGQIICLGRLGPGVGKS